MNNIHRHALLGAMLSAALLATGCASQRSSMGAGPAAVTTATVATAPAVTVAAAPRLSPADVQFIAVAAGSGMYELEAARLAATRAASADVRAYAQMLVDHHTANNNELMTLVNAKGHSIAPELPAVLQQKVSRLSGLSGAAFDREFVRMTGVEDHRAAILAFERGRTTVNDNDVRAYIDKSLPVLRSHLDAALRLAGTMAG